jgi:hypothetical protein
MHSDCPLALPIRDLRTFGIYRLPSLAIGTVSGCVYGLAAFVDVFDRYFLLSRATMPIECFQKSGVLSGRLGKRLHGRQVLVPLGKGKFRAGERQRRDPSREREID